MVEDRCLALHADGAIDLLTLGDDGFEGIAPHDFFTLQHFLNRALPRLSSDPDRVMGLVEALVAAGGDDMASNAPNGALVEWCRADTARGRAVVDAAWAGDRRAGAHLTFALQGLSAIEEARRFVTDLDDERRLSGMTALGRIPDPDPASRAETLRILQSALGNRQDDRLAAHVVQSTAAMMSQDGAPSALGLETLRRALAAPGDGARNRAAHILWSYPAIVSDASLDILLPVLLEVNAEHGGTLREVDIALRQLLAGPFWARGLDLMAGLLSRREAPIPLRVFKSTAHAIGRAPSPILSRAVCTWMLSGKSKLCAALTEVLSREERGERELDLDPADLPVDEDRLVSLCRKVAGWLFMTPRLAGGALVSVLAVCGPTAAPAVQALLSGVLLRSYGGLHERLDQLDAAHPAKARVAAAVADNAVYLAGLHSVPRLKELRPSDSQRRIAHLHQVDAMRAAKVAADEESVFMKLVRHQTVLHGVRTLSFLTDPSGVTHPFRMELHSHRIEMEMPRMQVSDPVGLQLLLQTLRLEGVSA
ncbi:MAG TPA: hypothetical protein VF495_01055 [Phenylobacterium sp.]